MVYKVNTKHWTLHPKTLNPKPSLQWPEPEASPVDKVGDFSESPERKRV